jgi:hypothetical protein
MRSCSRCSLAALLLFTGVLAGGCSQNPPATTGAQSDPATPQPATPQPATHFPYGAKVDSLNGLVGHTFGQPLSAFPPMKPYPAEPGELLRMYPVPKQATGTWFAKHRREVPYQYYHFLQGLFYRFRAVGDPATLRAEALFLFGPGLARDRQLFWEGERARAVYSERNQGFGREGTLEVLSKPLEAILAAQAQAQLKADNAL